MFVEKYGEEIRKMFKVSLVVLVLIALFFLFHIIAGLKEYKYIGQGVYPTRTLNVTGMGEVYAIPDVGQFSFSVTERANTVEEAQVIAAQKSDEAIEALKALGVEDKDIKTLNYSVGPRYEYQQVTCVTFPCPPGRQTLVGYEVDQTISVKVRNLDESGELISAVTNAGATGVSNLSFTIDDMDAVRADARELAIVNAKEKAKRLAKDLGVDFVGLTGFYENEGPMYFEERAMMSADSALGKGGAPAPSLPTGENQVVSNVTLIYEIR